MQVILLEQVRKLGKVGEVVTVKNGYGRNFLIPNQKALPATKANIAYYDVKKKEIEAANGDRVKEAEASAKKIEGAVVPVTMQAGEDGRLFGSVGAKVIADQLVAQTKQDVSRQQIMINSPIKYIGIHDLVVELFGEVVATIHVNVARSTSEAKEAEARFKKGETVMEGPSGDAAEVVEEDPFVAPVSEEEALAEVLEETEEEDAA